MVNTFQQAAPSCDVDPSALEHTEALCRKCQHPRCVMPYRRPCAFVFEHWHAALSLSECCSCNAVFKAAWLCGASSQERARVRRIFFLRFYFRIWRHLLFCTGCSQQPSLNRNFKRCALRASCYGLADHVRVSMFSLECKLRSWLHCMNFRGVRSLET